MAILAAIYLFVVYIIPRPEAVKPEGWRLTDGVYRHVGPQTRVTSELFDARLVAMPEHIDDFIQVQNAPETMSFLELRAYVSRLREGGHRVNRYLVQLYSKLSFPLVHVIMALVAIPFALVSPRSGGRAMGIGVAIVIAAGYWVVHSVALAFAQADLLPAALAAWTANIVFAGIGTALFGAVESWAAAERCGAIVIETQNVNVAACRFYETNGCVLRKVRHHAYLDVPDEVQLLWEKRFETMLGK